MTPLLAAALGLVAGAGGACAALHYRHSNARKDEEAKKLLSAARLGVLPAPEMKKVAVAFGVESVKRLKKGDRHAAKAYEHAMHEVAARGSGFGGFHYGEVLRDVGAIAGNQYLNPPTPPAPPYPPNFAPDLFASGPYDYHQNDGYPYPGSYPGSYRHHDRHF